MTEQREKYGTPGAGTKDKAEDRADELGKNQPAHGTPQTGGEGGKSGGGNAPASPGSSPPASNL
jgi:hypothetical protein